MLTQNLLTQMLTQNIWLNYQYFNNPIHDAFAPHMRSMVICVLPLQEGRFDRKTLKCRWYLGSPALHDVVQKRIPQKAISLRKHMFLNEIVRFVFFKIGGIFLFLGLDWLSSTVKSTTENGVLQPRGAIIFSSGCQPNHTGDLLTVHGLDNLWK